MTKLYLLLALFSCAAYASAPFIVGNLIDQGLTASQAVVTDSNKQLASVARGTLSDAGTDGIVVTNGGSSVFGAGTSLAQHVSDTTHNGYVTSTDWNTFNSKFNLPSLTLGSVLFSNGTTIAQDNANFFWDATNHRLGLRRTPQNLLDVYNSTDDIFLGSLNLIGQTNNDFQTWALYPGATNTLQIFNKNLNSAVFGMNYLGQMMFGAAGLNHPSAWFLFEARDDSYPSLVIKKHTSQTTDAFTLYDTDEVTKLFNVTIAGKAVATNFQDTAFSVAGVVTNDSSGNFISTTTLPVSMGGTGLATLTAHALYAGNGTSAPTALAVGATNTILHGNTGADPGYSAVVNADIANSTIDLTTKVTGSLPAVNGGTGAATLSANGVVLGQGTSAVHVTGAGTSGQVLTSNGAGVDPTFQPASGGGGQGAYSGTMVGVGGGWTNGTNAAYVDFSAATTSNTLTQTVSSNITCAADAGKTPAIACTLPATGNYFVCATGTGTGNTGAAFIRLVDGSATVINGGQEFNDAVASQGGPFSLCGFYTAAGTSITFKLQGAAPTGNSAVFQDSQRPITWSVAQFK